MREPKKITLARVSHQKKSGEKCVGQKATREGGLRTELRKGSRAGVFGANPDPAAAGALRVAFSPGGENQARLQKDH
jgi:hypothetical protein